MHHFLATRGRSLPNSVDGIKTGVSNIEIGPAIRALSKSTGRCARSGGCYPNSGWIWLADAWYSIEQSAIMQAINTRFCL